MQHAQRSLALLSLAVLGTGASFASPTPDDEFAWPQWDGPERDNHSKETAWSSAGKEEHLWEAQLGLGYSTVSVADGRLYTMGYDAEAKLDVVWCLDALTGEELWAHAYEAEIMNYAHEGGSVNTPSIDGDVVYTLNREGKTFCLDAETGEVKWENLLLANGNIHELEVPTWGFSASPLVLDDQLLLNCGRLLSLDKESGEVQWITEKNYGHAYGTPTAFELEGKPALVALNAAGVVVVSRESGEELYFHEFGGQNRGVNAATPIVIEDAVFVSSGTRPGGALLAFGEDEMIPVWENREMANSFSGCVRMGDHLYGFDQSTLKCIDLEGNSMWEERGIGNGAVLGAGDRLLVMGGNGEFLVCEATPEEFKKLSGAQLFEEGRYWTKPILVNGIIYCRNNRGHLIARDHRMDAPEK